MKRVRQPEPKKIVVTAGGRFGAPHGPDRPSWRSPGPQYLYQLLPWLAEARVNGLS
jgi:hypothetical protein